MQIDAVAGLELAIRKLIPRLVDCQGIQVLTGRQTATMQVFECKAGADSVTMASCDASNEKLLNHSGSHKEKSLNGSGSPQIRIPGQYSSPCSL